MVLTQANIQANISQEEGDLLVWSTAPIDYHLVEAVRKKGIFRNVWYLERPMILVGKKVQDKVKGIRYKKKFYFEFLERLLADQKYDEFVTSGFWNDTLLILKYLKKANPNIKIGISEEGLLNYYCGDLHKHLYYMVQYTRKQKIKAYLNGGRLFKYVQKNIIADYLTAPGLMRQEVENEIYPLPPIDESNPVIKSIVDEVFDEYQQKHEEIIEEYNTRQVCYMIAPHSRAYDPVDRNKDVLELILNEVPLNLLIIKTHTNATKQRREFRRDLDEETFVDRNVYLFEVLLSRGCQNIEDKIFIIRNSSTAIYLTQMFKVEPTFIFIHRLCSRYHYGWDDCGDYYVADLKKNMKHPERVIVPNSYVELKVIIHDLCSKFENEETKKEDEIAIPDSYLEFREILSELFKKNGEN